jgi:hypothetical protein
VDQLQVAIENEDYQIIRRHEEGIFFCLELSFGRRSSTLLKSLWYSDVLIELFQVVIAAPQRSEKCLQKCSLIEICLEMLFGIANLQLFQPIFIYNLFASKLGGLRGRGEPEQFVRKLWISCRLQ